MQNRHLHKQIFDNAAALLPTFMQIWILFFIFTNTAKKQNKQRKLTLKMTLDKLKSTRLQRVMRAATILMTRLYVSQRAHVCQIYILG